MLNCPNCNAENQDTARFCFACGTALEAPKPEVEQPTAYQQPEQSAYEQPAYQQPEQPAYEQPVYQQPVQNDYSQQGSYQQQSYQQPIYPQPPQQGPAPVKNWLVANIITGVLSLLCCSCTGIITGIIGIIFSAQVNAKLNNGDISGAQSSSNVAKVMFIVTLVLLILAAVVSLIYMLLMVAGVVDSAGMYAIEDMFY